MTHPTAVPFGRRAARRRAGDPPALRAAELEVVTPDLECAGLLLEYASPLFAAELVVATAPIVRLLPTGGPGWVIDLFSLLERWLEAARLPCAKVLYGGRSYLIRVPLDQEQFARSTPSASATS